MSDFDLKAALNQISRRVTPEEREAQERRNREGRNLLSQKLAQNRIALAHAQELAVLENIKALSTLDDKDLVKIKRDQLFDRLSELYAEQGRYKEAIKAARNKELAAWFKTIEKAIDRDPDKTCKCPVDVINDRAKGRMIRVPAMQKVADIIDPRSGRLIPLMICRHCGFANTNV